MRESSIPLLFLLLLLVTPRAMASLRQQRAAALDRVNAYRRLLGLSEVRPNALLDQSAQNHALYCLHSRTGGHGERAGGRGYTGKSVLERTRHVGYSANVLQETIYRWDDASIAVDRWVNSLYHRRPFVSPGAREAGFGVTSSGTGRSHFGSVVANVGAVRVDAPPVVYPADGQFGVPGYFGRENPDPLPAGVEFAGNPITLTWAATGPARIKLVSWSLQDSSGNSVPCWALHPANDRKLEKTCAIIPKKRMKPNERYTATFYVRLKSEEIEKTWSFTTGIAMEPAFIDWEKEYPAAYEERFAVARRVALVAFLRRLEDAARPARFVATGKIPDVQMTWESLSSSRKIRTQTRGDWERTTDTYTDNYEGKEMVFVTDTEEGNSLTVFAEDGTKLVISRSEAKLESGGKSWEAPSLPALIETVEKGAE